MSAPIASGAAWPPVRLAQWFVLAAIVVASFAVDAAGNHTASWALDGVALAAFLLFRIVRTRAAARAGGLDGAGGPAPAVAVTDATFDRTVTTSETTVLVDFWARWCGPCRAFSPVLERFAADHPEITLATVDVDENPLTAARHGIEAIPTLVVYQNGQIVKVLAGARPRRELEHELADFVNPG